MRQPELRILDAWKHQADAYWFAHGRAASMLAMDMGTGKSKVAVDLLCNWKCRSILVLCPVSVRGVWRREFAKHAATPIEVLVLDKGTTRAKAEAAVEFARRAETLDRPFAVVVNYESAWRTELAGVLLSRTWDCVICDESHRLKSPKTKTSKFADAVRNRSRRRLCLTGTPMPHSPLDVFGQYRFLDPGIFGRSWHRFRHNYACYQNAAIPQMVTGYKNEEDLQDRFRSIAYRVDSSVLDLPDVQHHTRTCELPAVARRVYRDIETELIAQIGDGVVTAANALVKSIRLRQIVSGFAVEEDTEKVVWIHEEKASLLADLLEDFGPREPVVVFAEFKHDLAQIERVAITLGRRYGELSGRRHDLTETAEMPYDVDVLGVQYQSGGVGIDLTRARYGVYYSPTYSLGNYAQSLARIHRPGQGRPVSYYHLVAEGTVDEVVRKALANKQEVVDVILSIFNPQGAFV